MSEGTQRRSRRALPRSADEIRSIVEQPTEEIVIRQTSPEPGGETRRGKSGSQQRMRAKSTSPKTRKAATKAKPTPTAKAPRTKEGSRDGVPPSRHRPTARGGRRPPRGPARLGRSGARRGLEAVRSHRRYVVVGLVLALVGVVAAGVGLIADRYLGDEGLSGPAPQTTKKTMWGPITYEDRSLFPTYRDLGVGIYATQIHWDTTAPKSRPENPRDPKDPAYVWPSYVDYAVSQSRKQGIDVMIQIIGAPSWANGGRGWRWSPDDPGDYADFAVAAAKRYKNVRLWMVWGEPNRAPNFQPLTPASRDIGPLTKAEQVAPRRYAQLLDATYAALKGLNPENQIIGGNTYTAAGAGDINTYQWLEYLRLPNGERPRMDLWGHNPYGFQKPDVDDPPSPKGTVAFRDLDDLTEALDEAYPEQELKLFLSEWGVPIGYEDEDLTYSLNREEGEEWIRAGFEIARDWDRIFTLGWVHPVDTPYSSQGLLNKKGNPKPGYDVYKDS